MHIRTFTTIAVLAVVATATMAAQRPRGWQMQSSAPMFWRGPLPPDSLSAVVSLDNAQRQRYTTLYVNFVQHTQPQRDSLRTIATQAREARRSGDRSKAQSYRATMRELHDGLSKQQKPFDEAVKKLLTADQWKKYEQWQKDVQKQRETERGQSPRRGWSRRGGQ